ncbi:hypothetical protein DHEL01_v211130 [Diaporthe helianthi]|uniref:Uncharacterized protein n=1 Tax=Diaporthe helianthi TaxID=158607 RepID=A0A2P5HJP2_DIAHE|nr:hypothetical protein DHEL01_v211130 [Diaporthe helianthi]
MSRVAASFSGAVLTKTGRSGVQEESMVTVQEEVTHIEEPEEPSTVLTRLALERPNPLADLESLLPVRHDFDDENGFIALCNDLLVLNSQEHRDPTRRTIKIPGTTGVFISPNQFYHAWHLLSQRGRDLHGGILADEAGTGKTYVYFATVLLRALAWESKRAVQLYWNGKGKKKVGKQAEHHLPQGGNGRSCPSQKQGGISCYCVSGSLTRTICDSTPSGVSALYVATETWPDILNMVQTAGLNPSVYQLCLVHNNAPARFTRPWQPLVDTLSHGAQPDLKDFSPASYIFITTLESPRLRNIFAERILDVGFFLIDEAHQILRTKNSLTFRMALESAQNGADVWFVTATPFSGCTLDDWVPPMKCIAPRRASATHRLARALDLATSSGDDAHVLSFQTQFNVIFDRDLVVRHFGTSKFLGKSISDVQDIVPRVISRSTPLQHRAAVQELASQIAWKDPQMCDPAQRGLLYLVSLFPAAAELIAERPITFDTASIRDLVRQTKNRLRIEESEPLRRLADQIVHDSPKLDCILDELHRMGQDKRERSRIDNQAAPRFGAGEDLRMKKMVIITPTVVSAVFLYLALIRHRPDVALIHNWVSAQEKEQVVNNFKSLSAAKLVKHTRILIAPFAAIGTGANLQVASYQILTSPLPDRSSQVQAFARTNRSGQRLRPLSHKILVLEDSPVDRLVLASHATVEIKSDPFNISEPLWIADNAEISSVSTCSLDNPDIPTGAVEDQMSSTHGSTLGLDEAALFQSSLPFSPLPPTRDDVRESEEDNFNALSLTEDGEALLLQNAMSWAPSPDSEDCALSTPAEQDQRVSSTEADEALLLQNTLFWAPPVDSEDGVLSTSAAQDHHDLFNDLSSESSHPSTNGRQEEQRRVMSAVPESDISLGTHGQVHWSLPTYHQLGYRPLPPLPTDRASDDQSVGPSHNGERLRLFPPLPSGPPARVDVGPSLASRPDPFASTTAQESSQSVFLAYDDYDDDQSEEFEWIERPLTPYPEEMRGQEDDGTEPGRDLGNMDFDVEDLLWTARARASLALLKRNDDDWFEAEPSLTQ